MAAQSPMSLDVLICQEFNIILQRRTDPAAKANWFCFISVIHSFVLYVNLYPFPTDDCGFPRSCQALSSMPSSPPSAEGLPWPPHLNYSAPWFHHLWPLCSSEYSLQPALICLSDLAWFHHICLPIRIRIPWGQELGLSYSLLYHQCDV